MASSSIERAKSNDSATKSNDSDNTCSGSSKNRRDVFEHAKLMLDDSGPNRQRAKDIGNMLLHAVVEGRPRVTTKTISKLETMNLSGDVARDLRDLYVYQAGEPGKALFEYFLSLDFGWSMSTDLRSKMFVARHHVCQGKFTRKKEGRSRKPKKRRDKGEGDKAAERTD